MMNSATHTISVSHAVAKLSSVDRVGPEQLAQLQANPAFGDLLGPCAFKITYHATAAVSLHILHCRALAFLACYKTLSEVGGLEQGNDGAVFDLRRRRPGGSGRSCTAGRAGCGGSARPAGSSRRGRLSHSALSCVATWVVEAFRCGLAHILCG